MSSTRTSPTDLDNEGLCDRLCDHDRSRCYSLSRCSSIHRSMRSQARNSQSIRSAESVGISLAGTTRQAKCNVLSSGSDAHRSETVKI